MSERNEPIARPGAACARIGAAGLLALSSLVAASCRPTGPAVPVADPPAAGVAGAPAVPVAVNPGYVGPQACAECHAERFAEFRETRHFAANRVPDPGLMPAGFQPERGHYREPDRSLRFEMSESRGRFLQTAIQDTATGPKQTSSEIAFVYGSAGGNDEVYFTWHGNQLNELPMVWLSPTQEWGASPFDRHGDGDFSRETTIRCVECHNTWAAHAPGSRNQYDRDSFILGVTCEVCHGPGKEHVDFHRDHPQARQPHAVTQPAQLPRERLMDLCANCHSNALKHRGPAFGYRPGLPLDDFYVSLHTRHPEDDHVANQTTYLRQSRCFQESDSLTCVTCHNPHRPRSVSNAGAQACARCHAGDDCTDRINLPDTVRDDCIGCHMPERRKIQVFFQTESDKYVSPVKRYEHKIGIYPLARQAVLLKWHREQPGPGHRDEAARLAKNLAGAWRRLAQQQRGQYRFLAAIDACRESLQYDPEPETQRQLQELIGLQTGIDADYQDARWHARQGRYPQSIEAFRRVLSIKPDYAQAHAHLGTACAAIGEKALAVEHLSTAAAADPDDPYAPAMLGWLAYLDGQAAQAIEFYAQADAVEPYSAKINSQMGLALARLGRWEEAAKRYAKAVRIDPNATSAMVGASQALRQSGRAEEALQYALRARELAAAGDLDVLMSVVEALAAAGRATEAIQMAEKGLAAAEATPSAQSSRIRIRLDELRAGQKKR